LFVSVGFTHVTIEYDVPAGALGFGKLTPTLAVPPGSEIAVDDSSSSGPDAENVTLPTYVPFTPVAELSVAVGPDVSVS
jgi:hypothetical protein